jgi:HSP20 family molecular chaperone IbpA
MSNDKDVTETKQQNRQTDAAIRPLVDIFEDDKGITLLADMPGVSKERLDIAIDKNTLSIEGEAEIPMADGMEALYADVRSTHYQRNFSLSSELDGEGVSASLKDGLLTLQIPKRAQYQPRKIEVTVE